MEVIRLLVFTLGVVIVASAVISAIKTFVLPRSARDFISRTTFRWSRRIFDWRNRQSKTYEERDRIMAIYAPITLLMLPVIWLILVLIGFTGMFWASGINSWHTAFLTSGSSLLTLGFATVPDTFTTILAFSEAVIGLILIALLIAYLPTMYSAFSKREAAVTMLEVRAGSPPWAIQMIERYYRLKSLDEMHQLWIDWELWFVELGETHTSLAALNFFRSPQPEHSWITAAGAVLDAAALMSSTIDTKRDSQAELCIRAGYLALRRIADFFGILYDPEPNPNDAISIARQEYDDACKRMAEVGVSLKADREQAWRDFAGWRVNYDVVLLSLAGLLMAPEAPWSSDRSLRRQRPVRKKKVTDANAR